MMPRNERGRRQTSADLSRSASGHVTTFVEPPATLGDVLLWAEIDARSAARRVEWAAVLVPELDRTARFAFAAASRIRGDRLGVQP